jgi:dephospho-CoA kinase
VIHFIGLVGEAGAGKDTVAKYLAEKRGYRRVAFADEMKLFYGLQKGYRGSRKEVIAKVNAEKDRKELIDYGTAAWRDIDPNIWVKALDRRVQKVLRFYHDVARGLGGLTPRFVATDIRFPNELELVRGKYGGVIVKVTAPLDVRIQRMKKRGDKFDPSFMNHPSERFAQEVEADFVIDNGGDLADTVAQLEDMLRKIK